MKYIRQFNSQGALDIDMELSFFFYLENMENISMYAMDHENPIFISDFCYGMKYVSYKIYIYVVIILSLISKGEEEQQEENKKKVNSVNWKLGEKNKENEKVKFNKK